MCPAPLLLFILLVASHLAEGHRQQLQLKPFRPEGSTPQSTTAPNTPNRQAPVRAAAVTAVDGAYFVGNENAFNYFDPTQLSGPYSVPDGYGNAGSSNGVPVQEWVEFGWQNTEQTPPAVTSVNITEVPSGYTITWTEALGDFSQRGADATVTLNSTAFQDCASITRVDNTFPSPLSESLSGSSVILITGNPTGSGNTYEATWRLECARVPACTSGVCCDVATGSFMPEGMPCPWQPRTERPLASLASDKARSDTARVPADTAAAWLTGQPQYSMHWPPCHGKCMDGHCVLSWDHPACCYIRPRERDEYEYKYASQQADKPSGTDAVTTSSMGYWHTHDFYCWK